MMSMFWNTASAVPAYHWVFGDALAGRQDVEALVALRPQEVPAALQMADQAVGLVLRRDADAADAGIERVRQGEVDDARLAAEIDRGLGAPVGQLHQAAAAAAGQHIGHGVAGERGGLLQFWPLNVLLLSGAVGFPISFPNIRTSPSPSAAAKSPRWPAGRGTARRAR